ncbi:class I tRNA ligase family protein [Candidatus Nomurabacteria bacterium]|nr:class I tRNA ligase family protein [Candidatus Nomurabacteria bacterium]
MGKKSNNSQREEETLKFWKENDVFNKSLTKDAPKGNYVFYDGPPFATGLPHYGHILGSTVKDVIGRYQTMRGFRVPRKWGWDTHGLPIENIVEKDLGISGRKAIEEYGVDKFAEHARSSVLKYVAEWKKTVDRIGRWVDFDNSYMTMDNSFIESVWWALGQMNDKGLLYEGVRVLAYCPRCETPIANSEIAMDNSYKDITDISVYVKFRITSGNLYQNSVALPSLRGLRHDENSEKDFPCYLLAWTTTPWTLPGNTAIAVNNSINYIYVKNGDDTLILAKDLFEKLKDKFTNPEIIKEVKGSELVGLTYEPVFDYYKNVDMPNKENIWKVWHADFVTADQGTGIAHEAPAFGEDDMNLAKEHNIPFIRHVEPNGIFTKEVADFPNVKAKPKDDPQSTDVLVIKYLAGKGTLFAKEKIIHSYPHCYRCDTPLLYYALPSWFVNIQKVKENLLEKAKSMNWIPEHLKEGRFKNIMENAPDWTISRNRFWASPLPIWKSESGKLMFVNSLEDLKKKTKKSGNKYFIMRHGQAENNTKRIVSSGIDSNIHLTEEGKNQINETIKKIKDYKFDYVFVSPIIRTQETLEILKNEIDFSHCEIKNEEAILEIRTGEFEGKSIAEYNANFSGELERFTKKPKDAECLNDVKKRVGDFLYKLESEYVNKNILIISHGDTIWMMQAVASGITNIKTVESVKENYPKNAEFKELNFIPLPYNIDYELDMHRPYIDAITLVDEEGTEYRRIPEVIDCWFESGSMPFAQDHYPFERPDWKETNFPGGFVAEYIAQTRTWFYYSHVISTILFGHAPFENVVTTGTVLAEDGSKMSKSKNNFPDPLILFDKYGVDALRFYLMSSPLMKGEDVNFSERTVQEIASKIVGRLENVLAFYELYRDKEVEGQMSDVSSPNVLDQWILARLNQLTEDVTKNMEVYDMALATRPFELFIEDLSTWYLRRSRERIKDEMESNPEGKGTSNGARATLYFVLKTTAQLLAPFTPFISESIWQKLKLDGDVESVHLAEWPKGQVLGSSSEVLVEMQQVRDIVTLGLEARQKAGIKVRQPLGELRIKNYELREEYNEILKDELNVKNIKVDNTIENEVQLDTNITEDLKREGDYRELLRAVQDMRKKEGLMPSDIVTLTIATDTKGEELIKEYEADFKKTVGAKEIKIEQNDGVEIKIGELLFKVSIIKC